MPQKPDEKELESVDSNDYSGQTLAGRYRIGLLLGKGGMGSVYAARHVVIGRPLAVKIVDSNVADSLSRERLFREAETAAAIGHPNIIDVVDAGVSARGHPYLVMEFLEGEDLAQFMQRRGPLSLALCCAILEPILSALAAAHARGVVHRDLKPSNIYLVRREDAPPTIKLIDFGIAKVTDSAERVRITTTGTLLGTPAYMAPEQALGADVDARADLYAMGVLLFEMLTGKHPFEAANYNQMVVSIVSRDPTWPDSARGLPPQVRKLISRAMQKRQGDRFQSARELLHALEGLAEWPERTRAASELAAMLERGTSGISGIAPTLPSAPAAKISGARSSRDQVATVIEGQRSAPAPGSRARARKLLWVAAGLAVVSAAALFSFRAERARSRLATSPAAPSASARQHVEITLNGVPRGATIFYDGAQVSENPFRVPVVKSAVPIRIELAGYQTFETTLVPQRDTMLGVALERVPLPTQAEPAASADASKNSRTSQDTSRRATPVPSSEPLQINKSGRNTLYSEKFE